MEIDWNISSFELGLQKFTDEVLAAIERGVHEAGDALLTLSVAEVPHGVGKTDTDDRGRPGRDPHPGALQASGKVDKLPMEAIVGYYMPYAARLHEHPEYHFQHGRKGKYLEDPLKQNADKFLEIIGQRAREALSK